jgi:hypothetical protein
MHKFVGPYGFRRLDHMRATIKERIELTEEYGEVAAGARRPEPIGSSFSIEGTNSQAAVEALRREVAPFIGDTSTRTSKSVVVVPFDGTESIESLSPHEPPDPQTSRERATLPA